MGETNWIGALSGAANTIGGLLRTSRLSQLSSDVQKAREKHAALVKQNNELLADLKKRYGFVGVLTAEDYIKGAEIEKKMDIAGIAIGDAQSALDKAQSEQTYWQAGTGAGQLVQSLGYGGGLPGMVPQQVPMQVQQAQQVPPGYVYVQNPAGQAVLMPLAVGFAGGMVGGYLASRPATAPSTALAAGAAK